VCHAYQNANSEIRERILRIEGIWLKTESQVEAIKRIWPDLNGHVQIHQNHVLALLQEKLQVAIAIVDRLESTPHNEPTLKALIGSKGDTKKLKYVTYIKGKLDAIVVDLEEWHRRFDPSWYLLARVSIPSIDEHLVAKQAIPSKELSTIQGLRHAHKSENEPIESRNSVFFPKNHSIDDRKPIQNTSAEIGNFSQHVVVIDSLHCTEEKDIDMTTKDVRDIARILANVDPTVFSLFACQGVAKKYDSINQVTGFEFIFTVPTSFTNPRSLRTFLLTTDNQYPLDNRFRLAQLLGKSVSFLHSSQIVHKNISPQTVLLLENTVTGVESPFLVGFEKFRRAEGRTYMSGDSFWEKNIYRHPKRQGERPEEEYRMQHDIYSLGVCLLEIGLGTSFVEFDITDTRYKS
jgi:serine/threonine protein kinase